MNITDYHAKYFAYELTKRCPSDSFEKFAASLSDEVGLGKSIKAGILLSQKWAERKRKILIILPSSLRKQWHQELKDKFFLPSMIMEAKPFNRLIKQGVSNPFVQDDIVLCS